MMICEEAGLRLRWCCSNLQGGSRGGGREGLLKMMRMMIKGGR